MHGTATTRRQSNDEIETYLEDLDPTQDGGGEAYRFRVDEVKAKVPVACSSCCYYYCYSLHSFSVCWKTIQGTGLASSRMEVGGDGIVHVAEDTDGVEWVEGKN